MANLSLPDNNWKFEGGRQGRHSEHMGYLLADLQYMQKNLSQYGMVKSVNHIWDLLNDVFDPEVPVLSVVDLGIVRSVEDVENVIHITITPTYIGCPAMQTIEKDITKKLEGQGMDIK